MEYKCFAVKVGFKIISNWSFGHASQTSNNYHVLLTKLTARLPFKMISNFPNHTSDIFLHVLIPNKLHVVLLPHLPSLLHVLKPVARHHLSISKCLGKPVKGSWLLLVVEPRHTDILHIPGYIDHFAIFQKIFRKEAERKMGLDKSWRLHTIYVLKRFLCMNVITFSLFFSNLEMSTCSTSSDGPQRLKSRKGNL